MSIAKFKTLRHIETVRNLINFMVHKLLQKGMEHDQTKLQSPEAEILEENTEKLRTITYGSAEYKEAMKAMKPFIEHHNAHNTHHPEHYPNGINDMTLIDLMELVCDWKAATMRHNDGNILKSLEINAERFNISPQLRQILMNTFKLLENTDVPNHANES